MTGPGSARLRFLGAAGTVTGSKHLVRAGDRQVLLVFCTPGTRDLLEIMLLDSAHIQEQDAERANRLGYTKHRPALPLYTVADAEAALRQLETRPGRPTNPRP